MARKYFNRLKDRMEYSPWDNTTIRDAVSMYVGQNLNAKMVAQKLGSPFTRCSVISKMRRLKHIKGRKRRGTDNPQKPS
jgi:hypothetical protein